MSTATYTTPFTSHIFTITVGPPPNTKTLHAHASILSASPTLRTAIQDPHFRESAEQKLTWPHWSVPAAERFLEWLYGGDYGCPYPSKPSMEEVDPRLSSNAKEGQRSWGKKVWADELFTFASSSSRTGEKGRGEQGSSGRSIRLQDLTYPGSHPLLSHTPTHTEQYERWARQKLGRPDHGEWDFGATFMTHAELYVMACFYSLPELKNMAWQRLRAVLASTGEIKREANVVVVDNVVELARYAYRETEEVDVADGKGKEEEPLRMLVATFAALNFAHLKRSAVFTALLQSEDSTDRTFMVDVMDVMAKHMTDLEETKDGNENDISTPPPGKHVVHEAPGFTPKCEHCGRDHVRQGSGLWRCGKCRAGGSLG